MYYCTSKTQLVCYVGHTLFYLAHIDTLTTNMYTI